MGWVKTYQGYSQEDFYEQIVVPVIENRTRAERGLIVVFGAEFFLDQKVRQWLLGQWAYKSQLSNRIAAIYGLAAHLDDDEELTLLFTRESLKHSEGPTAAALKDCLFIWRTANGSGRCSSCGTTGTSPSMSKPPASGLPLESSR